MDITKAIYKQLRKDSEEEREKHISSGKLSAGRLGDPIQWQVLHALGVKGQEVDDYTLGKFKRGQDVENRIVELLLHSEDCLIESTQKFLEYRDCIGYLDIKTKDFPIEVKSVTNMAFKWIVKENKEKLGHALQATLYGLALGSEYSSVLYVASDDYRTAHFIFKTDEYREQVEEIIENYNKAMKGKYIPVFKPLEKWQESQQYCLYPKWRYLTEADLKNKFIEIISDK